MAKFSDLLLLWPFANEFGQTLFAYNQPRAVMYAKAQRDVPPNDGIAMFILSTALGRIAMDDSTPHFYLIGHRDASYEEDRSSRHLIYIGGRIYNDCVEAFLSMCSSDLMVNLPSKQHLFSTKLTTQDENNLNDEILPDHLEKEFLVRKIQFSQVAHVYVEDEAGAWLIEDKGTAYFLRKDGNRDTVNVSFFKHVEPRWMQIRRSPGGTVFDNVFQTEYYDSPANEKVRTDYGLILLANNPFADEGKRKALLVAGLHSYGTLAAARFASYPSLSAEIVRCIMGNFHAPPHLFKTVEVIVRAEVERETGELLLPKPEDIKKHIECVFVNGRLIYGSDLLYDPLKSIRPAVGPVGIGSDSDSVNIQRPVGTLLMEFEPKHFHSSSIALPMTDVAANLLSDQFFKHFAGRHVIVCSPHSDDSAIACGGLIYYLRNEELWNAYGYEGEQVPRVHVLVITESARGVPDSYLEDYCKYIRAPTERIRKNEGKADIRNNESLSESLLLSTNSHWLGVKLQDDNRKETRRTITDKLLEILGDPGPSDPIFLIPNLKEQHPTHKSVTEIMLGIFRKVFSVGSHHQSELESGMISKAFREEFRSNELPLSPNIIISVREEGQVWLIVDQQDSKENYFVKREQGQLDIYRGFLPEEGAEIWLYESPWSYLDPSDINVIIPLDKHAMFAKCQAISMHQSQDIRTRYSDVARVHSRQIAETLQETVYGFASSSRKWNYLEAFSARLWKLLDYSKVMDQPGHE